MIFSGKKRTGMMTSGIMMTGKTIIKEVGIIIESL
jgi:hypothetical protein